MRARYRVVVGRAIYLGVEKVLFTGTYEECVNWASRFNGVDILNPMGRLATWVRKPRKQTTGGRSL